MCDSSRGSCQSQGLFHSIMLRMRSLTYKLWSSVDDRVKWSQAVFRDYIYKVFASKVGGFA